MKERMACVNRITEKECRSRRGTQTKKSNVAKGESSTTACSRAWADPCPSQTYARPAEGIDPAGRPLVQWTSCAGPCPRLPPQQARRGICSGRSGQMASPQKRHRPKRAAPTNQHLLEGSQKPRLPPEPPRCSRRHAEPLRRVDARKPKRGPRPLCPRETQHWGRGAPRRTPCRILKPQNHGGHRPARVETKTVSRATASYTCHNESR